MATDEGGGEVFLHDVLSVDQEDPPVEAARRLDWEASWSGLSDRERAILELVAAVTMQPGRQPGEGLPA